MPPIAAGAAGEEQPAEAGKVSEEMLQEATRRIVERFDPERIILFGSQARGRTHRHSDVDLLVLSDAPEGRRALSVAMDEALGELNFPSDIIVLTPEQFERDRRISGTVARPASVEGRVLYERPMSDAAEQAMATAREWFEYASEDLRLAEHALTMGESAPLRLIAFHAQQCAEKCLKAILVARQADAPATHSIRHLLNLCREHGDWAARLAPAHRLSTYAVAGRYPGALQEITRSEALEAIRLAKEVRQVIRKALTEEGALRTEDDEEQRGQE
jgi:HEPN domain-containing protein/predicted nucleotidyltransferase